VRAAGGYVIWWPAAGFPALSDPVMPWPEWLHAQHSPSPRPSVPRVPDRHALNRLVQFVVRASAGERNNLTYWAACRAGEMVASGLLKPALAAAIIIEAGVRSGLPRSEAERTAWSGIRRTGGGRS
jgi:hypothetical protein